ncbi:hypothetical protein F4780DRAFT_783538 [Xylariomycetidae sp. FL0641]|nr:hypothetical protein F4780DRAFT_783538 [Xylariomycetidae sp. FL0641]
MEPSRAQRLATVRRLLDGYGSLSVPRLLEPLSADFVHRVQPGSLGSAPRRRDAFGAHAEGIFGVFDAFAMVPDDPDGDGGILLCEGGGDRRPRAVVRARMQGTLKRGGAPWTNECVLFVVLSPDATEVVEVVEFVDSAKAREMARRHAPSSFADFLPAGGAGAWLPSWFGTSQLLAVFALGYVARKYF